MAVSTIKSNNWERISNSEFTWRTTRGGLSNTDIRVYRRGDERMVVFLNFGRAASTPAGDDLFSGELSGCGLPIGLITASAYYDSIVAIGQMYNLDGNKAVVNFRVTGSGVSIPANAALNTTMMFVVDNGQF